MPGDYHHGDLRQALLDAAIDLLEREGVLAISTRALARKLGVSHAAPHRHFPDRAALVSEVAAVAFERFADALEKGNRARPDKALEAMGRAYIQFAIDSPEQLRLIFGTDFPKPIPKRLEQASARAFDVLETAVIPLLPKRADVAAEVFAAWALVHGAAMLWLDGSLRRMLPKKGREAAFRKLADGAIARAVEGLRRRR